MTRGRCPGCRCLTSAAPDLCQECRATESLEWWQDVFGDVVTGWTFKNSASLLVDGETTNVGPKFRQYMARRMAQQREG